MHGEVPQRLFTELFALGEATGTYMPKAGIANVCPTLQSAQELMTDVAAAPPGACSWY